MVKSKFSQRGDLLRRWIHQAIAWRGSIASVAKDMDVHPQTLSRIIVEVKGRYQSNGSKETVRLFQQAFGISEDDYEMGPENYPKPGIFKTFHGDRLTLVYQLSHVKSNLNEIPTGLFTLSFQHLDNWRDFVIVLVDLEDRGLPHGVQAVIHKMRVPKNGDTVFGWLREEGESHPSARFIVWDGVGLKEDENLFGVCVRTIHL